MRFFGLKLVCPINLTELHMFVSYFPDEHIFSLSTFVPSCKQLQGQVEKYMGKQDVAQLIRNN
jgi:hypothetical protein